VSATVKRVFSVHSGRLHGMAVRWLRDRANPEPEGGLGMFADTRFCLELTRLLEQVQEMNMKKSKKVKKANSFRTAKTLSRRKCSGCGKSGHNVRTCPK
jgi:hypothetical protein